MSEIRGFDPSLVQRKHIFPKTLLYGDDLPGIKLRLDRFEEILKESGDNPSIYPSASDALGYLSTGDMFSDDVCVIVKDISDALRSDTAGQRLYKSFMRTISTYGDSSTIVLAAPGAKDTAAMSNLLSDMGKLGGTSRSVIAPNASNISLWLDEYAKSTGRKLTEDDKRKLISISGGDADVVKDIISSIGMEISNLSEDDIRHWMDCERDFNGSDVRAAIMSKDVDALARIRASLGNGASAYRTFLLKIRLNVIDLLIPSAADGTPDALVSYKSSQYANANGNVAYFIARESQGRASYERLARIYAETNRQLSNLVVSKDVRFEDLLISIVGD